MWRRNDIAFHQSVFSPILQHYLINCNLIQGDQVLVPLCGKSHDMDLLADSGFEVMGVELSKIAIEAYFEARKVTPIKSRKGSFIVWKHNNIEIWCGDIFDLNIRSLDKVKLMYDCASLTAFSSEQRKRYVQHFKKTLPNRTDIILLTTETPEPRENSHKAIDPELNDLYQSGYQISLLYGEENMKSDPQQPHLPLVMMQEKLYLLQKKPY